MANRITLQRYVLFAGTMVCQTGLRIGASKEEIEIGGIDNPIVRDPVTKEPYIPGSSIKGKVRTLMEYRKGLVTESGEPHGCKEKTCMLCTIFGPHKITGHELGPSRLIVRDARLSDETKKVMEKLLEEEGLQLAEVKTEVMIDRRTGVAHQKMGPRKQERLPAGAKFNLNMSLRIFDGDDEKQMVDFIKEGLSLLQKDYLGGSGTRGYGWVKIENLRIDGKPANLEGD